MTCIIPANRQQNVVVMPTKRRQDGGQKTNIGLWFTKKRRISSGKRNNRGKCKQIYITDFG